MASHALTQYTLLHARAPPPDLAQRAPPAKPVKEEKEKKEKAPPKQKAPKRKKTDDDISSDDDDMAYGGGGGAALEADDVDDEDDFAPPKTKVKPAKAKGAFKTPKTTAEPKAKTDKKVSAQELCYSTCCQPTLASAHACAQVTTTIIPAEESSEEDEPLVNRIKSKKFAA